MFDDLIPSKPAARRSGPVDVGAIAAAEGASAPVQAIARSVYMQESSGGRNTKTSNAGAVGGMQITPATFARFARPGEDINDPEANARAAVRYLKHLETKAGGDPQLIAVGYYGGEGAIPKARAGIAVRDPRNPGAPGTLQYGREVAERAGLSGGQRQQPADLDFVDLVPQSRQSAGQPRQAGTGRGDGYRDPRMIGSATEREQVTAPAERRAYRQGRTEAGGVTRGLANVLQGPTFGFADEIGGGIGALIDVARRGGSLAEAYRTNRDYLRGASDQAAADNPILSAVTQGMASAPTMAVGMGANLVRGAGLAANTGRAAIAGGVAGGIGGAGRSTSETAAGVARDAAAEAAIGGTVGAALPGAAALAGRAISRPAAAALDRAREIVAPPGLSTADMGGLRAGLYGALGGKRGSGAASIAAQARAAAAGGGSIPAADDAVNAAVGAVQREAGSALSIDPRTIAVLKQQVTAAMARGETLDAQALVRQRLIADTLGPDAAGTVGQITRDPMQYAQELNLRGIVGVGEQMQGRMQAQNRALIGAVRGDAPLPDAYDAGAAALSALREVDKAKAREVSAAYGKFRDSGQGVAEIPLQSLASRYAEVLDDFGTENIPSAIQRRVGQYFSPDGSQIKLFTLDEANKLLTQINAHYDPTKPAQQAALSRIKAAVQEGVEGLDDGAGSPLLKEAIAKARERFQLHDALPALKDVSRQDGGAQERFVRDYVMGGSVDQVKALAQTLPPDALAGVRGALRRQILEAAAPGAADGRETATISQAALRRAIEKIGPRKMQLIFGDEAAKLASVQQVAEWLMKEPAGAAVNRSNTAGAVANLLSGQMPGSLVGVALKKGREVMQTAGHNRAAVNALAGEVPRARLGVSPAQRDEARVAVRNALQGATRFFPAAYNALGNLPADD